MAGASRQIAGRAWTTLKQAIPEAKIVFVIRDPRSTALSFAKVYARRREEHFADPRSDPRHHELAEKRHRVCRSPQSLR